jgi:hypothetical protein
MLSVTYKPFMPSVIMPNVAMLVSLCWASWCLTVLYLIFTYFCDLIKFLQELSVPIFHYKNVPFQNFLGHLFKTTPLIKNSPILIILLLSFSFNRAMIFCINTCAIVLINQYSTGLFVSYSVPNCMKILIVLSLPRTYLPRADTIKIYWHL